MPMPPYPVLCYTPGCGRPALYKIAARWTDGTIAELKTYGLACEGHSAQAYRDALRRRKVHPPSNEEKHGEIGLYHFEKGQSGAPLEKVADPS